MPATALDENGHLSGAVQVRYGYHYSGEHHLREQLVQVAVPSLTAAESELLTSVFHMVRERIPAPTPVRLPHATVVPIITLGGFTFVAHDQRQAALLPVARLCYHEDVPELASRVERQIRLTRDDWAASEMRSARRLRAWVRAVAGNHIGSLSRVTCILSRSAV